MTEVCFAYNTFFTFLRDFNNTNSGRIWIQIKHYFRNSSFYLDSDLTRVSIDEASQKHEKYVSGIEVI